MRVALGAATGPGRKQPVEADVISPPILDAGARVEDVLAGDFLFAFGGFFWTSD